VPYSKLGKTGVPSAMVFVRNTHGSICPEGAMKMPDVAAAASVIARLPFAETPGP
jgi:hypothetical protein